MSEHVLRRAEIADRKKLTADPIRWSVLAVVGLFYLTYIIGADIETILASTHDDAAYYLQIARNLTDGNGLSFDTIHRTNGFHPLWLYCVLPLAVLFDDPQTLYRSVLLLQLGLVLVTGYLLATVLSRFTGRTGVLTGLGIFVFLVLRESLKGMETALSILLVVVLCWAVIHRRILDRGGKRDFLEMGLLMGAMVLARLDNIFIVIAFLGIYLWRSTRWSKEAWNVVWAVVGLSMTVGPYLIWNLVAFGELMPISGVLKTSFPNPTLTSYGLAGMGPFHLGLAGVALVQLVYSLHRLKKNRRGVNAEWALAGLAGGVVLHAAYTALFADWGVFKWHFVTYVLLGALTFGHVAGWLYEQVTSPLFRVALTGTICGSLLVAGILSVDRHWGANTPRNWQPVSYRAAIWARDQTDPDTIFAMKDAGNFGLFSERRVINLDGVVNNRRFQDVLKSGALAEYLAANHVRYLVRHAFPALRHGRYRVERLRFESRLYDVPSDPIRVRKSDEVYVSTPYLNGDRARLLIIWDVDST